MKNTTIRRIVMLLTLALFIGGEVAQAQWYRLDKHAKKGWRNSRKWLKKAAKTGVDLANPAQIERLAEEGLSVAEGGIGDLANFAEDLAEDALEELEELAEELAAEVMDVMFNEAEPYINQTGEFLIKLWGEHPELAQQLLDALMDINNTGSPSEAYDVYLTIHETMPEFQELIDNVTSSGLINSSILISASGGGEAIVGGGASVGIAIEPGPTVNVVAFYGFGGSIGFQMPGGGVSLDIGFGQADPQKIAGPGLTGAGSASIGVFSVGANVEISLPKIKGSFPDYSLEPPDFSSFTVSAGVGAGIPVRGAFGIGGGYTALIKGSELYFDPNSQQPQDLFGTEDGDQIDGSNGKDVIYGLEGDDVLNGHGGIDVIEGGEGDDVINPGAGRKNVMYGDEGDDRFIVGWADNYIHCGEGEDVIVFPKKKKQYTINRKDDRVNIRQKDGSRNHFIYLDCERVEFENASITINN